MNRVNRQEVCDRFNKHNFHDSKLISFIMIRKNCAGKIVDDLCLDLLFLADKRMGRYKWVDAQLILENCGMIRMDLNLIGKQSCSDDIMSATCMIDSILKREFINSYYESGPISVNPTDYEDYKSNLEDFLHFNLTLIPPGGSIDVFAKDFVLKIANN